MSRTQSSASWRWNCGRGGRGSIALKGRAYFRAYNYRRVHNVWTCIGYLSARKTIETYDNMCFVSTIKAPVFIFFLHEEFIVFYEVRTGFKLFFK
jgi:hypothetical protein